MPVWGASEARPKTGGGEDEFEAGQVLGPRAKQRSAIRLNPFGILLVWAEFTAELLCVMFALRYILSPLVLSELSSLEVMIVRTDAWPAQPSLAEAGLAPASMSKTEDCT